MSRQHETAASGLCSDSPAAAQELKNISFLHRRHMQMLVGADDGGHTVAAAVAARQGTGMSGSGRGRVCRSLHWLPWLQTRDWVKRFFSRPISCTSPYTAPAVSSHDCLSRSGRRTHAFSNRPSPLTGTKAAIAMGLCIF